MIAEKRYSLYLSSSLIFHIVLVSFVIFLHLILEHGLSTIEDWVYHNFWQLLIISKVFLLGLLAYNEKLKLRQFLNLFTKEDDKLDDLPKLVFYFIQVFVWFFIYRSFKATQVNFTYIIGNLVFFVSELALLALIIKDQKLGIKEIISFTLINFLYLFLLSFGNISTFSFYAMNFITLLWFSFAIYNNSNLKTGFYYILFIIPIQLFVWPIIPLKSDPQSLNLSMFQQFELMLIWFLPLIYSFYFFKRKDGHARRVESH